MTQIGRESSGIDLPIAKDPAKQKGTIIFQDFTPKSPTNPELLISEIVIPQAKYDAIQSAGTIAALRTALLDVFQRSTTE